jgi:hypothetical protein
MIIVPESGITYCSGTSARFETLHGHDSMVTYGIMYMYKIHG